MVKREKPLSEIVCVSSMDWEGVWTRKQRFMAKFAAAGSRVLYVEPPGALYRQSSGRSASRLLHQPALVEARDRLFVLRQTLALPGTLRFPLSSRVNARRVAHAIWWATGRLDFRRPALWVYHPYVASVTGQIPHNRLVYDCVDNWEAYPKVNAGLVGEQEARLLHAADVVLSTSAGLLDERILPGRTRPSCFVPNGVDFDAYQRSGDPDAVRDIVRLPRPRIGFVGGVAEWIDVDLIAAAARRHPAWSFVLIGPASISVRRWSRIPNLVFPGARRRDLVPSYIRQFDVCLCLFRAGRLSDYVNPIKVYEYLAAGKPVVASRMPELVRMKPPLVFFVDDVEGVEEAVRRAMEVGEEEREAARAFAKRFDWDALWRKAARAVEDCAPAGGVSPS